MENRLEKEAAAERSGETAGAKQPGAGLTVESLLNRMDAIRQEMLSMKELTATMEVIANQGGEDDAGHIAEAVSTAFTARETTCQQQLRFLERIYGDHFSAPDEQAKAAKLRMILDSMNDVIPALDYSDENGRGSTGALREIRELYKDLLKQA